MRITILPAIGTDWATAEIEDGTLPIEILSPRKLTKGEAEFLVGRLYTDVCRYKFELDLFKHLAYLVPLWGIASGVAVYLSLKVLFGLHIVYGAIWTWNILWLMADGIWLTIQVALKGPQWWRARKAFKSLGEHWTAKVVVDKGLITLGEERDRLGTLGLLEHDWAAYRQTEPRYGHLYSRLLKRYPPRFMDMYPYGGGAGAHIANMIRGVPVRRPWMCYPMEK